MAQNIRVHVDDDTRDDSRDDASTGSRAGGGGGLRSDAGDRGRASARRADARGEGGGRRSDDRAARERSRDPRGRTLAILATVVLVALLAALILPSGWFSVNMRSMTLAQWMVELQHRVEGLVSLVTLQGGTYSMDYVTYRYLVVAIAGAALGMSGAVFQGSLRNALASPSTLGVMTGCNLGRILYVCLFAGTSGLALSGVRASEASSALSSVSLVEYIWTVYGMAVCALACGVVIVVAVIAISTVAGKGRVNSLVMIIVGQVFASVIGAGLSLVQYYFTVMGDARAETLRTLQVEAFTNTFRAIDVLLVGVPALVCFVIVMLLCTKLNALAFGNDEAQTMGVATQRIRWITVLACTALTGVIVAFCGQVGMIGFMVPHLTRRLVGPDLRYLVPASALAGAGFLVIAFFVTSLFESGLLAGIGVYTSVLGGLVFLVVAIKQRGRGRGDWM